MARTYRLQILAALPAYPQGGQIGGPVCFGVHGRGPAGSVEMCGARAKQMPFPAPPG